MAVNVFAPTELAQVMGGYRIKNFVVKSERRKRMRATLEQLKAMTSKELHGCWGRGEFPFDFAEGCGYCVTQHGNPNASFSCSHSGLRRAASPLWKRITNYDHLGDILEEVYALRLFYDSLYLEMPTPQTEQAVAIEVASVEVREKES